MLVCEVGIPARDSCAEYRILLNYDRFIYLFIIYYVEELNSCQEHDFARSFFFFLFSFILFFFMLDSRVYSVHHIFLPSQLTHLRMRYHGHRTFVV